MGKEERSNDSTEGMARDGKGLFCGAGQSRMMVILCALCGLLNYADRINMSVAIIPLGRDYGLNVTQRGAVLGAFFWGYVPSQLIAALLCRRYGAKRVLGYGAAGWSLFTLLTPICARGGLGALVACRVAMGLTEGVAFPAMYHVFAEWVPANERGRAMSWLHTGVGAGTTLALVLSPEIIQFWSWHGIFYFFGGIGFFWVAAWAVMARDAAKTVLLCSSTDITSTKGMLSQTERRAISFMVRNRTCIAQVTTQFLTGMFLYTCLAWLPTYFTVVYAMKESDVWFTFVPCLAITLLAPFGGMISDGVASRAGSIAMGRKVTTGIACVGAGIFVLLFAAARNVIEAIGAISAALSLFSLNSGGYDAAYLDIAEPQYAALFKSVANTLGALSGAIAVPLAAKLLQVTDSWRVVFACQALWVLGAGGVYVKFGSTTTVLTEARFASSTPKADVEEIL